jgi:selenide, water dikinase
LQPLTGIFPTEHFPSLLVGLSQPDDAAVYAIDEQKAIVSTVDFFPPVVDDPYTFGAIAAANAMSDIYAMGGEPLFAINLVAFPDGLGLELLTEILRGGAEKVREANAVIAGGHTVVDKEPKYGLAVTGIVERSKMLTKGGAKSGDKLILTKPLGTGVVTTALKNGRAAAEHVNAAVESMSHLNRTASQVVRRYNVHAMTDITGYSLIGHAHEMAHLSLMDFRIYYSSLMWLPGARDYAEQNLFPGGMHRNQHYYQAWVHFEGQLSEVEHGLLYDPETSGGLLIAVDATQAEQLLEELIAAGERASLIGEVIEGKGDIAIIP